MIGDLVGGKVRRFVLSVLQERPIGRLGDCNMCGACCKIGYTCPALVEYADGTSKCSVYAVRPPNCRAFPLTPADLRNVPECSFVFAAVAS